MRLLIAHELPSEVASYVQDLRADLSERFSLPTSRNPPHITLKYFFDVDPGTPESRSLENTLKRFADAHAPADYEFLGFGDFKDPAVVYLKPVHLFGFRMLHLSLLSDLKRLPWMPWDEFDGPGMHFHATLLRERYSGDGLAGKRNDVMRYLNTLPVPHFSCALDALTLYERVSAVPTGDASGDLVAYRKFPLSS